VFTVMWILLRGAGVRRGWVRPSAKVRAGNFPDRDGQKTMRTTPERGDTPVLMILESYPEGMPVTGPALPAGSGQFRTACRRWGLPPGLLARVPRLNALERRPSGCWFPRAHRRVGDALAAFRPTTVVAAGWVARLAVAEVLRLGRNPEWLTSVRTTTPDGRLVRVIAVPHYSTRGFLLNDRDVRKATSATLHAALSAG
jgi:hypothetical protein